MIVEGSTQAQDFVTGANEIVLRAPSDRDLIDLQARLTPGKVAVLMDQTDMTGSGLYLPPSGILGQDTGFVIGVSPRNCSKWPLRQDEHGPDELLAIGDYVAIRPNYGIWIDDWMGEGNNVRFYGVGNRWEDAIVAKWDNEGKGFKALPLWIGGVVVKDHTFIDLPDDYSPETVVKVQTDDGVALFRRQHLFYARGEIAEPGQVFARRKDILTYA